MNVEESYFLGLIWGDGSIDKNRVKIHCHSDEVAWHNILFSEIKSCFNVTPTVYYHKTCKETDICINRKWVEALYASYKIKGKWYLPDSFVMEEIIAGLIDSDGSFSLIKRKTGRIGDWARSGAISMVNRENAELIQSLLNDIGLNVKLTISGSQFVLPFYGYRGFNFVRENIPIKHPHKKLKLGQILNSYRQYSWGLHGLVGEV